MPSRPEGRAPVLAWRKAARISAGVFERRWSQARRSASPRLPISRQAAIVASGTSKGG
jgi:hypothetical protein